jgi:hypothetical protein
MPTQRVTQTGFASGEFDPLLWNRSDTTMFFNSARLIENAVPLPQGGIKRREGWAFKAKQRGLMSQIDISAVTITATNGGTAANARDDDDATAVLTTGAINAATTYEVLRVQFGSAQAVAAVDLRQIKFVNLPGGISEGTIAIQSSDDGATWTTRADMLCGDIAYNRRLAVAPDTVLATAAYWRVAVRNVDALDFSTAEVSLGEIRFWAESGYSSTGGTIGNFSMHRLTANVDDEYVIVMTARAGDIYRADTGAWVAAVDVPYDNGRVLSVKNTPNVDTVYCYQDDYPPFQIQRLDGDENWSFGNIEFESIPDFEFTTGTISGGENEVQRYAFAGMTAGDTLVVEFNGDVSVIVTWDASEATNAAALETAIEGLEAFDSVTVAASGTGVNAAMEVTFAGLWEKQSVPTLIVNFLTGSGTATMERLTYGKPDTAPLWGGSRGYPSCGTLYQGRHYMGGFRARPDVMAASRAGAYLDFKEDFDPVVGSPFVVAPNTDDEITIENIFPGRHLQIFASSGEFYVPDEPITVDNIAIKSTSRFGSSARTQPVDVQGGTLFIDRNGRALREYLYTDGQASYTAEPVSLLAGHLLANPRSLVLRRARNVDEPALILIANNGQDRDGNTIPAAMVVIDRAQQVTAFARVRTTGTPLGFATSQGGDAFAMVRRSLAGKSWNYLEQFDSSRMSDCSLTIANPDMDEFTATAGQTVFTWTFTNPTNPDDVGVWRYVSGRWVQSAPGDYTKDTTAKTITFDDAQTEGREVRILKRQSSIDLTGWPFMEGIELFAHSDGLPLGSYTVDAGLIDLGDQRYDFAAEVGLRQVPRIVLHPYKASGDVAITMHKMRIFDCLLQLDRTGDVSIGMTGYSLKPVPLTGYDRTGGVMDPSLEDVLYTGAIRTSGMGRWLLEPCLEITQVDPMPFLLRSVSYDVRF